MASFDRALAQCRAFGARLWEPRAASSWKRVLNAMEKEQFSEPFSSEAFGNSELAIGIKYNVTENALYYRYVIYLPPG